MFCFNCLAYVYSNCSTNMQDTFRGRVCECQVVKGVKFVGDGYTHCEGNALGFIFWHFLFLFVNINIVRKIAEDQ